MKKYEYIMLIATVIALHQAARGDADGLCADIFDENVPYSDCEYDTTTTLCKNNCQVWHAYEVTCGACSAGSCTPIPLEQTLVSSKPCRTKFGIIGIACIPCQE